MILGRSRAGDYLPAVLIELKWNRSAQGALAQIKSKQYAGALNDYQSDLLLVGINYDREKKLHSCEIERYGGDL